MWGRQRRYFHVMDRKRAQRRGRRLAALVVFMFFFYHGVTFYCVAPVVMGNPSMEPAFGSGSALLYSPMVYGLSLPLSDISLSETGQPQRGDAVVVRNPDYPLRGPWFRVLNRFVLFFTFQKVDLRQMGRESWEKPLSVKRIIGIPGDTLRMEDYLVRLRPRDEKFFLTEYEWSGRQYEARIPNLDGQWKASFPFTGNGKEITLGEGEYYLLGDNRGKSWDSRSWGPVDRDHILGRVILEYWSGFDGKEKP